MENLSSISMMLVVWPKRCIL